MLRSYLTYGIQGNSWHIKRWHDGRSRSLFFYVFCLAIPSTMPSTPLLYDSVDKWPAFLNLFNASSIHVWQLHSRSRLLIGTLCSACTVCAEVATTTKFPTSIILAYRWVSQGWELSLLSNPNPPGGPTMCTKRDGDLSAFDITFNKYWYAGTLSENLLETACTKRLGSKGRCKIRTLGMS